MSATHALTADLQKLVKTVEADLLAELQGRQSATGSAWQAEHASAVAEGGTALSWAEFRANRVTQVAVSWVLTTVFVRFCEDNALVRPVWISGPESRRQEAVDGQLAYFREHPEETDREWLKQAFRHLAQLPATRELVEDAPYRWLEVSGATAERIIAFWRERDDSGAQVRDLADPELSTRFLGDLYQDLSEHAKKTFALLQTPVFVEEFILDRTLEPALEERPLEGFRLIDPTCGSGHFLLGAFSRLLARWRDTGATADEAVEQVLASVVGVDLNPFAVAIARFRLTVAALQATGRVSLEDAPAWELQVFAGDSLLHGRRQTEVNFGIADPDARLGGFQYAPEELEALRAALAPGTYDVVVGNPPYITVKDKALNAAYRGLYPATTKGKYALSAPFLERFFDLARPEGNAAGSPAGWTGQITANSFMKREFGVPVVEKYLPKVDLQLVADTSGAYIPGHGTPTVILVGRHRRPQDDTVRAVLGIQGEPGRPAEAAEGKVWRAIADHVDQPGHEDQWVSVLDAQRASLATHPWSLQGGAAPQVGHRIDRSRVSSLEILLAEPMGPASFPGQDEVFFSTASELSRSIQDRQLIREVVTGDAVRDWEARPNTSAFTPYDDRFNPIPWDPNSSWTQRMWRTRSVQLSTLGFGGHPRFSADGTWWEWYRWIRSRYLTPMSITFAFVATHNHFVLDRGGKVFKQSAPVIKLPADATEDDHYALLGVLNSSVACFWLKQNSHNKGNGGIGGGIGDEPWEPRYEFTSTTLQDFPLPAATPPDRARRLDTLARERAASTPAAVADSAAPTADVLASAHAAYQRLTGLLVAEQEELDWENYAAYGFIEAPLAYAGELPEVRLGERAFEIALARRIAAGEASTEWFARHGSTPVTEIPERWPAGYRALVQRRLDLIEADRPLNLLERPEYKRRWQSTPWDKQVDAALRGWLLDRLESREFWFDRQGRPQAVSVAQLADRVSRDEEFLSVLRLWAGSADAPTATTLTRLLADEAVPHLAAQRMKESGLRKFEAWQQVWDIQRRQDAGEDLPLPPAPPKYTTADFRKNAWWSHRGKLDVPKERFILYPQAGRAGDPTPVLGWAGWDHAQQALALIILIGARQAEDVPRDVLLPLVAGLAELQPWVRQWHGEMDEDYGMSLAEFTDEQLAAYLQDLDVTPAELAAWRPAAGTRGRPKKG
ncbi:BREX-2 system adenine-specific DNA-methyltransferase PglX [Micrococcus luteus]|uniref:BREX-2 system adenine-specific DNA-methyltransferase PglX n=1 Tax=Micrococcus TaxID=1269 RepID=UPI0011A8847C|nr:BREX-2 system adenine-specific DNA-methyltransferase PglX [Micrococcus luteus]MCV7491022.1 BREX-2 system adenine-specific DNA-methyltransferase PglX [Micrococcus luteus]MCV7504752.1 BREX-2 system adenine-specific DNA-methyltransferase PglX [Micrococcus luteus]MCV7518638.1 BREX-2 system adenine-specific DNA-methyltransferase PglX [Micrococcus luteus]MCV7534409.1 BREX-2 system adenine-specific DNA-methyltransferase PglX [Micrococcus luteus]MCV7540156.1 BREX-2 system adenine-specific DNA-methy